MYIQVFVAIPDDPEGAGPSPDVVEKISVGAGQPGSSVGLGGNVHAASELQKAIRGRGWRQDLVVLGPIKRPKFDIADIIVNCICDPAFHQRSLETLATVVSQFKIPVLNHPWAVMGASRASTSYVLDHQAGVNMPLTSRYDVESGALAEHLAHVGHRLPVLGRPVGAHGGHGLLRIDSADKIPPPLDGLPSFLVTDFVDYVSLDGLYRKYRVIYVNDRLFRRHLVISDSWKVAGESREVMAARPELIEEEKTFVAGQGGDFESRFIHQFRALGLDFGVVDFNIAEDGGITIFEINPCFQLTASIPPEKWEIWKHLEDTNEIIVDALLDAMEDRARGQLRYRAGDQIRPQAW